MRHFGAVIREIAKLTNYTQNILTRAVYRVMYTAVCCGQINPDTLLSFLQIILRTHHRSENDNNSGKSILHGLIDTLRRVFRVL